MQQTPLEYYREKYAGYSGMLKRLKRTQRLFVTARISVFLLMVFLPLALAGSWPRAALALFLLLLAGFLVLVSRSAKADNHSHYISRLLEINLQEIEAFRGNLDSFDEGVEFLDPEHPYALDIDIFGAGSLFQYINRCCTWSGKERLAGMLLYPETGTAGIQNKQSAFRELAGKMDLCQHFNATGRMLADKQTDRAYLLSYVEAPSRFSSNFLIVFFARFLPVVGLGFLVFAIAGILPFSLLIMIFLLQLGITGMLLKSINEIHAMVSGRLDTLKKYSRLLRIISEVEFETPLLVSVQKNLLGGGHHPAHRVKQLARICSALDNRLNIIASVLLNGMFLWDVNCVLLLEGWNAGNRKHLPVWLDTAAQMDAFISFGIYTFNNPGFVFPVSRERGPVMLAEKLGHPLIGESERVTNDFVVSGSGRFIIITGANMAGKSTFLRTAGVAMILAMAGGPVCASRFDFRIMDVYTSMRTNDSLNRNESYFYAELKRLKLLFERIAAGRKVFVILDEILKGTNSDDKQRGSALILEQLISLGATGIIATHDLSLTRLGEKYPEKIKNQCFEVEIEGEKIFFDYRLRDGVTKKMNALLLMKQMGLLIRYTPPDKQ